MTWWKRWTLQECCLVSSSLTEFSIWCGCDVYSRSAATGGSDDGHRAHAESRHRREQQPSVPRKTIHLRGSGLACAALRRLTTLRRFRKRLVRGAGHRLGERQHPLCRRAVSNLRPSQPTSPTTNLWATLFYRREDGIRTQSRYAGALRAVDPRRLQPIS